MSSAYYTAIIEEMRQRGEVARKAVCALLMNIHHSTPEKDRAKQFYTIEPTKSDDTIEETRVVCGYTEAQALVLCFDEMNELDSSLQPYEDMWNIMCEYLDSDDISKLDDMDFDETVKFFEDHHSRKDIIGTARCVAGYYNEGNITDRRFQLKKTTLRMP